MAPDATRRWVALLGKPDTPADGVEDYCTYLGGALSAHGVELQPVRVHWAKEGAARALMDLWRQARQWRGSWVLFQYTAMAWSRRGFPIRALAAMVILRWRGARCVAVFHEPCGSRGPRVSDRIRERCQNWVIRRLFKTANRAIFLDPLETISWLRRETEKAGFIPIGANIPEPARRAARQNADLAKVGVFCLSEPPFVHDEVEDISKAVRKAVDSGAAFRLVFLGRGTAEASAETKNAFAGLGIDAKSLGLLPAERVAEVLATCDVMLCVRGRLYMRRGSAIAGLAAGLAIVGYEGAAEGTPLVDSGVVLVPYRDGEALGTALARLLADRNSLSELQEKSRQAYSKYFCWPSIAGRLIDFLATNKP